MRGKGTVTFRSRIAAVVLAGLILAASCSRHEAAADAFNRALSFYIAGNFSKTIDAASREEAKWKSKRDSPWYWRFRLLRAEALIGLERDGEALRVLDENAPAPPAFAPIEARRQVDRAEAFQDMGASAKAREILAAIANGAPDTDVQIRIQILRGFDLFPLEPGAAAQSFERARQIAAAAGNTYREAGALNNLSMCRHRQRHDEEAIDLASRALDKAKQVHADRIEAQAYGNLGNYSRYLGNFDRAESYLRQAITAFERFDSRGDLMTDWNNLGLVYDAQEEYGKAIRAYERAYRIAQELNRNADAARFARNLSLAFIHAAGWQKGSDDWNKAAMWNGTAARLASPAESQAAGYLARNSARIAFGRGRPEEAARICKSLIFDPENNSLRWEAYAMLGSIEAEAGRFKTANADFEAALTIIDKTRLDLNNAENRITLLSKLIPFYQQYVEALVKQGNEAKALAVVESSRARALAERLGRDGAAPKALDPSALKAIAKAGHASLLSFWMSRERSFVWLITAQKIQRFDLPPAQEIEALVESYRKSLEFSWGDPIATKDVAGQKLWSALLERAAPHIPKGSRVIVIPDGALHRLNLETLPVPGSVPHYWIEDVEIAVAPSVTVLIAGNPGTSEVHQPSLLLIGDPSAVPGFDRLPLAKAEIGAIQSRFPDAPKEVLTGPFATPASYKQAGPERFSLIHFAAHAEANRESPLESAVILSPTGNQYRLHAREIIDSKLTADLVTISGCRSAGVRAYAGEGLIGFAWAFLQAGSRAVIAGLWNVNDGSSQTLMDGLYGGIAAGQNAVQALRNAKLALLNGDPKFRKPYFWAPFQIYVRTL